MLKLSTNGLWIISWINLCNLWKNSTSGNRQTPLQITLITVSIFGICCSFTMVAMKKFFCFLAFFLLVEIHIHCYSVGRMPKAFRASPTSEEANFQPILLSPNSRFALGFKRVEKNHFLLSIVCVADLSSGNGNVTGEMVWTANRNNAVKTSSEFVQDMNGSLALRDAQGSPAWEVSVNDVDAVLALLDSGNLQLQNSNVDGIFLWQSFDHPTDTLLEAQNFTATMSLIAAVSPSNYSAGEFSLQMESAGISLRWKSEQVYWRRLAMQEKALIVPGNGQIYARLESDGYIAVYQTESRLVDVFPLDTYHQKVTVRRLKIESDGNLRAYYWSPRSSRWEIDLVAVQNNCQLPSFCGPRALCTVDSQCTCLRSGDENQSCLPGGDSSADFCARRDYSVARIPGIDVPFSLYSKFTAVESESECRDLCAGDCGCAAAVFYNNSKRCYAVRSPLQTVAEVATVDKVGFVKYVNETIVASNGGGGGSKRKAFRVLGWAAAAVVSVIAVVGASAFIIWRRKLCYKRGGVESDDISIQMSEKFMGGLPYKHLTKQSSML